MLYKNIPPRLSQIFRLCLCKPNSNAIVERFFKHIKIIITDWRSEICAKNFNSLFSVKVEDPEFSKFADTFCSKARKKNIK